MDTDIVISDLQAPPISPIAAFPNTISESTAILHVLNTHPESDGMGGISIVDDVGGYQQPWKPDLMNGVANYSSIAAHDGGHVFAVVEGSDGPGIEEWGFDEETNTWSNIGSVNVTISP